MLWLFVRQQEVLDICFIWKCIWASKFHAPNFAINYIEVTNFSSGMEY